MTGLALPVVRVAGVLDVLRRAVRDHVRPRADRLRIGVRVKLALVESRPDVLGNDRRLVGDEVEERLGWRFEGENDLVHTLDGHARQRTTVRAPERVEVDRLVALHRVERVGHIGGAEGLAVAPGHAVADRERERLEAVRPLRGGRQHRDRRVAALENVHELERLVDGGERDAGSQECRIERVELAGPGGSTHVVDDQLAADLARAPGGGRGF